MLCNLINCMLSTRVTRPELRKQLAALGFDVEALRKCIGGSCTPQAAQPVPAGELERRLLEAVRATLARGDAMDD